MAIGGTCLLATGDLDLILKGKLPNNEPLSSTSPEKDIGLWMEEYLPRFDQIRDSVGAINVDQYFVVFEDSFFADLVAKSLSLSSNGRDYLEKSFRQAGEAYSEKIKGWLELSCGSSIELRTSYSSEVQGELKEAVKMLAERFNDKKFLQTSKSAINIMYTQLWVDILKEKSILPQDSVAICSEPIQHLLEVIASDRAAYSGTIQRYLRENPWGCAGDNESLSAYGFVPSVVGVKTGKSSLSRFYPYSKVVNKKDNEAILQEYLSSSPFPLYENPVVRDALNFLSFDQEVIEELGYLVFLEQGNIVAKKKVKGEQMPEQDLRLELQRTKQKYLEPAEAEIKSLRTKLIETYSCLGFGVGK